MVGKREKPEDIVLKLRQVEVLQGQGNSVSEAVRQFGFRIRRSNAHIPQCSVCAV
jgi:putative transposase